MAKKKTRAEEYAEIPIEFITQFKTTPEDMAELIKMVNTMRQGFRRRVAQFERAGEYSYAADKYARDYDPTVRNLIKGKSPAEARNILVHEFARYQSFFEAKSSSLEGIRKINRDQDIRIFGESDGEPLGTLTLGERRAYWAMYSEFLNSNEALVRRQGSDRIQQMLADFTTDKARFNIPDDWSSKMGGLPYLDLLNYLQNTKGLNISDNKG